MSSELVGYKLTSMSDGVECGSWGGIWGQCPGIPNPVVLPTKLTHVHCAEVGVDYEDFDGKVYRLEPWVMEPPPPAPEKSTEQKLAEFLAANPDVLAVINGGSN